MSTRTLAAFSTVRTEGAMLPSDILVRVASGDKSLGGLEEASYHLAPGEKIGEATNRAWNRLQAAWANFQAAREKLPFTDTGTSVTRERWLLPLFQLLDYGRLQAARAEEIDGRSYAVSHAWQQTPIHLVGCNVDLDRRIQTAAGGTRSSPHSLLQELLNRSDQHLWGIVSNGLRLRLLRDNVSLTRQAYVEFDLEAMMAGEAYPDFVLLWLLLHQSRFEAERPDQCQLENWSKAARTEGVRVLDGLRDGVQRAIECLGQGFLAHPSNSALKESLHSGVLDKQDYYRQILRLVYRLLFLFVADDRGLLLTPTADPAAQKRYRDFYATTRLRRLATTRAGSRHYDLYCGLKLVMEKLSGDGCPELALPALGSFLFSPRALQDLNACEIANLHLMDAIRSLAVTQAGQNRRVVDYKNLGAEELGSVYESLLELHPDLNTEAATFELKVAGGSERKKTGSYYTPTSLISCLLDSALDPVLMEAANQPEPESAILKLKVVDPACGSGHFLIAAAHRIAKRLATVRTGEEEPPPESQRKAIRDVIGHCIYGVDVNPMAVELCKVSLWMEALEPGKPLSFLEHRIQCGNSLLGATPAVLAKGIPDEALLPIEGDDKEICKEFKRVNKDERNKQMRLFAATTEPWLQLGNFAASLMNLDTVGDDSIEGIRRKERMYQAAIRSGDYLEGRFWADTWCAAFVWTKTREFSYPITEEVFRRIERNPHACEPWMRREIELLARQYRFFHWHLAYPDVYRVQPEGHRPENRQTGWSGGFDLVLGNPPWEKIQIEEKHYFASIDHEIATASASERKARIADLESNAPKQFAAYQDALRDVAGQTHFARNSGMFPLAGRGNISTHSLFVEQAIILTSAKGRVGLIVPSGLATQDSQKDLFKHLMLTGRLRSLYDFENRDGIFLEVHRSYKFCIVVLGPEVEREPAAFAFYLHSTADLADPERHFTMSSEDLKRLSPNTLSCPTFRNRRESGIFQSAYQNAEILFDEHLGASAWGWSSTQMFNETHESALLRDQNEANLDCLRLYEAKLIHQFDHRYATYDPEGRVHAASESEKRTPTFQAKTRFCVPQSVWSDRLVSKGYKSAWILAFRRIARATDARTAIFTILPRCVAGSQTPVVQTNQGADLVSALLANLNSFIFDFITRQKVGGTDLNHFIVNQLPVIPPSRYRTTGTEWLMEFIQTRVLELVYTCYDLQPFASELGYVGNPFVWDEERRFVIRAELDALFFSLYGVRRDDIGYVLDTFPIVRDREVRDVGEYRTKRVVLEIFDSIVEAERTGIPYQTRIDPPPADPRVAHPAESLREA